MGGMSESTLRKWRILSWLAALGFLALGIWWMFCLPTVGKGGIVLAVGATLMPLFWEKIGAVAKMSWIAMLFLLLAVEYRAIDKEHAQYERGQEDARAREEASFGKLLDKQQAGVQSILDKQDKDVKGILEQEQRHFERTLGSLVTAHRQEEHDFANLLAEEHELFTQQSNTLEFLTGKLIPASDPTPFVSPNCLVGKPDDIIVFVGEEAHVHVVPPTFPHTILQVNQDDVIQVDKLPSGALVLNVNIVAPDGKIIIRLDRRGVLIPSNQLFILRPDVSTLLIEDQYGHDWINVRYLNPHAIRVDATVLPIRGKKVEIPRFGGKSCMTAAGRADIVLSTQP